VFAENIRQDNEPGPEDDELRESMKAAGWLPGHPAIVDERGTVITGHRRLRIAEELGIKPQTVRMIFGRGDEADIQRLRMAWLSNTGGKGYTPGDRKAMAAWLASRGWTQASIGEALRVAQSTVSRDLREIMQADNSAPATVTYAIDAGRRTNRPGAGRPRAPVHPRITHQPHPEQPPSTVRVLRPGEHEPGAAAARTATVASRGRAGRRSAVEQARSYLATASDVSTLPPSVLQRELAGVRKLLGELLALIDGREGQP
jgi:hypothetical protein